MHLYRTWLMLCYVVASLADSLHDLRIHKSCSNTDMTWAWDDTMKLHKQCIKNTKSLRALNHRYRRHKKNFLDSASVFLGTEKYDLMKHEKAWRVGDMDKLDETIENLVEIEDWYRRLPPDAPYVVCDSGAFKTTRDARDIWSQAQDTLSDICE